MISYFELSGAIFNELKGLIEQLEKESKFGKPDSNFKQVRAERAKGARSLFFSIAPLCHEDYDFNLEYYTEDKAHINELIKQIEDF